jgi:hypothetical protein
MSRTRAPWSARALAALVLCLAAGPVAADAADDEAVRVRVLLAGDTGDPDIGPSVRKDLRTMRALLEDAFASHKDRLTLDVLEDRNVTRDGVLGYYRGLQTGPHETLLFYFSGHGGTERLRGHLFQVLSADGAGPAALWRDEVRAAMRSHRPRLCVLLSDVCSDLMDFGPREAPRGVEAPEWDTVRCLLLQARGLVDLNAVSEGESAVGLEDGGLFTGSLAELLRRPFRELDLDGDGFLHWQELLPPLQRRAQQKYAGWRKKALAELDTDLLPRAQTRAERGELSRYRDQLQAQESQTVRVYGLPSLSRFGARVLEGDRGGVQVLSVHADTPAALAGLRAGDVIVRIGGKGTNSPADFTAAVGQARGAVVVEYRQGGADGAVRRVEVRLPSWRVPGADG